MVGIREDEGGKGEERMKEGRGRREKRTGSCGRRGAVAGKGLVPWVVQEAS